MINTHSTIFKKLVACILSIVMVCTILFSIVPNTVYAGAVGSGPFDYVVLSDGTAKLTDYLGIYELVHVPSTIDGYKVSSIGDFCFYRKTHVEAVTFGSNITSIGYNVFTGCSELAMVTFVGDDAEIGDLSISSDVNLRCNENSDAHRYAERTNHQNLRLVDSSYDYFHLTDGTVELLGIHLPATTPTDFELQIPQFIDGRQVTVIGEECFEGWDDIKSITIPEGVRRIKDRAFYFDDVRYLSERIEVIVPDSVWLFGSEPFNDAVVYCNSESSTHQYCNEYYSSFRLLDSDFDYIIQSDGSASIEDYHGNEVDIVVPSEINGRRVDSVGIISNESIESVIISNGITRIQDGAFDGSDMESVTIPNTVTLIGEYAFANCNSLTNITIPDSVVSIGLCAFAFCDSLEKVVVEGTAPYIGYNVFEDCELLENITFLGDSVIIQDSPSRDAFAESSNITIYCFSASTAYEYAIAHSLNYSLLDGTNVTPTPPPSQGNSTIPPATGNTVDRSAAESFATRCYELVLNRTPDSTGLNNWTNSLVNNQNTGAHMAYGFFFSQEYINSNTSNEEFVTTLYNVFLDRAPDQGGLSDWVGQLNAGATREQIFAGVANSREFFALCNSYGITAGHYIQGIDNTRQQNVNAFVARLYSMCLGRNGDYDGQANWVRQLINRQNSGAGVAYGFFFSPEFINRNLTNEEYVATLYRVFLGREPDQAGFNSWVSQLNNGADRLSIFRGFAHSQEYTNICSSYGIERGSV